ncbi:MAG: haloacid dehalogenase type II [Marmoricola sp.]
MSNGTPALVVLDVNETLSDLTPLQEVFAEIGLRPHEVEAWFAGVLRDGFAWTIFGENPRFADLARDGVRARVLAQGRDDEVADRAADRVVAAFGDLMPHPDVVPGLAAIAARGCPIVTLTNGSTAVARSLLREADASITAYHDVAEAGAWKPDPASYRWLLERYGVAAEAAVLVAVHPWDLEGAHRVGMRTAWLDRRGGGWPAGFTPVDLRGSTMTELAAQLG